MNDDLKLLPENCTKCKYTKDCKTCFGSIWCSEKLKKDKENEKE